MFDEYYRENSDLLGKRKQTFDQIFKYLKSLSKNDYFILETGMSRFADKINKFAGDGGSTFLYDQFISSFGGRFITIDIDQSRLDLCQEYMSKNTQLVCSDSIKKLYEISQDSQIPSIDLLYLDSYDLDWNKPHKSALHHIKELLAILPKVKTGTLIVVDDNANGVGKGQYVQEFMQNIDKRLLFSDYQIGWVW